MTVELTENDIEIIDMWYTAAACESESHLSAWEAAHLEITGKGYADILPLLQKLGIPVHGLDIDD
jgi:hypothetical protein